MARRLARKAITENASNSLAIKGDMLVFIMGYKPFWGPKSSTNATRHAVADLNDSTFSTRPVA